MLATTYKCYIMKIKAVFQNAFKPKNPLAIQTFSKRRRQYRVCQWRVMDKNIHLQTTDATVQPSHEWIYPAGRKQKFKSRPKVPNKIILFQIHSSRPEAVPKLFPDVLTLVKYFIVESCCECSLACLFEAPGGKMNSSSLEGHSWRGRWGTELPRTFQFRFHWNEYKFLGKLIILMDTFTINIFPKVFKIHYFLLFK